MKELHRALMTLTLMAVVAVALGTLQPWSHLAEAQHGHHAAPQDAAEHFELVAGELQLTAEQREALAEPFRQAFAAMDELHRLHETVATQLTEAQKTALAQMVHQMAGCAVAPSHSPHDLP